MFLILMLSLPCVLTAASVGLVVGIIQAVTQVQEQTISAAPKIILVFTLIIFGGGVMLNMLSNYIHESVVIAFEQIPSSGHRLMPPRETDPGRLRAQKFYHQRYHRQQKHCYLYQKQKQSQFHLHSMKDKRLRIYHL